MKENTKVLVATIPPQANKAEALQLANVQSNLNDTQFSTELVRVARNEMPGDIVTNVANSTNNSQEEQSIGLKKYSMFASRTIRDFIYNVLLHKYEFREVNSADLDTDKIIDNLFLKFTEEELYNAVYDYNENATEKIDKAINMMMYEISDNFKNNKKYIQHRNSFKRVKNILEVNYKVALELLEEDTRQKLAITIMENKK